jgi:hypothetical protein
MLTFKSERYMTWVLVIAHIGFILWFYAGYTIGKSKRK